MHQQYMHKASKYLYWKTDETTGRVMNYGKDSLVNIIEHHIAEHRGLLLIISNSLHGEHSIVRLKRLQS
jgi:hypothetical protein